MYIRAVHLKEFIKTTLALLFLAVFLLFPEPCTRAAKDGLNIAMYLVLPSLFPFAVVSGYLSGRLKTHPFFASFFCRITGLPQSMCPIFLLGILSGFPIGAVLLADGVKSSAFSADCAGHALPLCTVCGPIFIIGVIGGGMLGSFRTGYILYAVQIFSLFLLCLLSKKFAPHVSASRTTILPKRTLVSVIEKAVPSTLAVCGFILFFRVVCEMLRVTYLAENLFPYPPFLYGLLEISGGCNLIALSDIPIQLKCALLAFLCSFSGICVLLQVASAIRDTNISLKKYLLFKFMHALLSFGTTYLVLLCLPVETVSVNTFHSDSFSFSALFLLWCYLLFALSVLFIFIRNKIIGHTFYKR